MSSDKKESLFQKSKYTDCISSIDNIITVEIKKLTTLKMYQKGLMRTLFPAEEKDLPEKRFPEFKQNGVWVNTSLDQIGDIRTGKTPSIFETGNYGGGYMFVSPSDIADSKIITETTYKLTKKGLYMTTMIPQNSILFVCNGSLIGKVALNSYDCAVNHQIKAFTPVHNILADFLYYALKLQSDKIVQIAKGVSVPNITISQFSSIIVKIPSDKEEQSKIATCLSSVEDNINAQTTKIELLKLYKKGMLQKQQNSL